MKNLFRCANKCMPIRVKAVHFFCGQTSATFALALPAIKFLIGRDARLRLVVHDSRHGKHYSEDVQPYGLLPEEHLSRHILPY